MHGDPQTLDFWFHVFRVARSGAQFRQRYHADSAAISCDRVLDLFLRPRVMGLIFVEGIHDDVGVQEDHGSRVIWCSSSHDMSNFILEFAMALRISARVFFFFGGAGLLRRTNRKSPF